MCGGGSTGQTFSTVAIAIVPQALSNEDTCYQATGGEQLGAALQCGGLPV